MRFVTFTLGVWYLILKGASFSEGQYIGIGIVLVGTLWMDICEIIKK